MVYSPTSATRKTTDIMPYEIVQVDKVGLLKWTCLVRSPDCYYLIHSFGKRAVVRKARKKLKGLS